MNQVVKKPNPAQVLAEAKQQNQQAEIAAKNSVENIVSSYTDKVKTLDSDVTAKLTEVSKTLGDEIAAARQLEDEKQAAYTAALEALTKAGKELEDAFIAAEEKEMGLKASFNKAAADIKKSFAAEKEAANKARKEALAAEKKKVAEAKAAGRSAVWAETKALVEYEIFLVKDGVIRLKNGVVAVVTSLKTAFNNGYNAPTNTHLPKSLAERQNKPANDQPPQP